MHSFGERQSHDEKTLPALPNMPLSCKHTQTQFKLTMTQLINNLLTKAVSLITSFTIESLQSPTFLDGPRVKSSRSTPLEVKASVHGQNF